MMKSVSICVYIRVSIKSRIRSAILSVITSSYILLYHIESKLAVMLSPAGMTFVCPGEQLTFVCSTNRTFIEWNVTFQLPNSGGIISRTQLVSSIGQVLSPLVVDMKPFIITKCSMNGLTSALSVANATTDLNGTDVYCTDIGGSLNETNTSQDGDNPCHHRYYISSQLLLVCIPTYTQPLLNLLQSIVKEVLLRMEMITSQSFWSGLNRIVCYTMLRLFRKT